MIKPKILPTKLLFSDLFMIVSMGAFLSSLPLCVSGNKAKNKYVVGTCNSLLVF